MIQIFPVWSHHDREQMRDLRTAAAMFSTSIAVCNEIKQQPDWMNIAEQSIRNSDCVLVILTPNSASSASCAEELHYASSIGKTLLAWLPSAAAALPKRATQARLLSEQAMDATQAVTTILAILNRSTC